MLTFDVRIRASGTVKEKKITVGSHPVGNNVTVHPGNKFAIDGLRWAQQPLVNHNVTIATIKAGTLTKHALFAKCTLCMLIHYLNQPHGNFTRGASL